MTIKIRYFYTTHVTFLYAFLTVTFHSIPVTHTRHLFPSLFLLLLHCFVLFAHTQYPDGESESPYVFICQNPQQLFVKFPLSGKHKICEFLGSWNEDEREGEKGWRKEWKKEREREVRGRERRGREISWESIHYTIYIFTGTLPKDIHLAAKRACQPLITVWKFRVILLSFSV